MFHVGQKVVCIKDDWSGVRPEICPRKGQILTVRDCVVIKDLCLRFDEIVNECQNYIEGFSEGAFVACNFRHVRTTDISIFEAMLAPPPKEKALVGADDPGVERRG